VSVWLLFVKIWRGEWQALESDLAWMTRSADEAPLLRGLVAVSHAHSGQLDAARAAYRAVLGNGTLDGPRDDNWLSTLVLIAEAVAVCGDEQAAAAIYPRLLPHAALNVAHPEMMVYFGSCAHWLGELAELLGKRQAAFEHFERALAMNTRLGSLPAIARTSIAYARLLMQGREAPVANGARLRAKSMRDDGARIAAELRMSWLLDDARELAL
jgi:tetratricopeptide (TPR) repeat protein